MEKEGSHPKSFYETSDILKPKWDEDHKMVLQANFAHEHRHENPQQNISKANLVTYKIVIPHDQEFILGMQDWFTIQKTTAVYIYE